jgi:multidrug efflux pump subunit AcrA (membrane-fusion protein)
MRRCLPFAAALTTLAFAAMPLAAQAQSFRCVGKDGKKYYGQVLPQACIGRPWEQLNMQGMVIKRYDPSEDNVDPAKKAAEEEKQREKEAAALEEARRSRALLATYTSVKDIDAARERALAEPQRQIADIEANIAQREKRLAELTKQKPAPNKAGAVEAEIETARSGIAAQQELLAVKRQVVEAIKARYDEDKKRYKQLTRGN